jgi:hypothetical protein
MNSKYVLCDKTFDCRWTVGEKCDMCGMHPKIMERKLKNGTEKHNGGEHTN